MSLYKLDWMFLTQEQSIVQRREALEKLKGCMQQFQTLATAKGATLVFLFHPTINDIKAGEMMSTKALLQYANEKGYHTVNALDEFVNAGINENNIGDFFWLQDGHNNSRGYKIIAEGIAKAL
jgi:lysophospholipase L1-like esterase